MKENSTNSLCLNFVHLLARKPNLEKCSTYSNKFFTISLVRIQFYLSWASGKWVNAKTSQPKYDGLLIDDKIYVNGD